MFVWFFFHYNLDRNNFLYTFFGLLMMKQKMFSQVPTFSSDTIKQKKKIFRKANRQLDSNEIPQEHRTCTRTFRNLATRSLLKHLMSIFVCLWSPSLTDNMTQLKKCILTHLLHQSVFHGSICTLTPEHLCRDDSVFISVILSCLSDTTELHSCYSDTMACPKPQFPSCPT